MKASQPTYVFVQSMLVQVEILLLDQLGIRLIMIFMHSFSHSYTNFVFRCKSIVVGEIGRHGLNAQKLVAEELDRVSVKSNETQRMEEYHVPEVPSELLLVIHKAVQVVMI